MLRWRVRWIIALSLLPILIACYAPPRHSAQPHSAYRDQPLGWQRYRVGAHEGYIKTIRAGDSIRYEVYDAEMRSIGVYTDRGSTYIHQGEPEPRFLGRYDADDSIRALHGIQSLKVAVVRMPMDKPLSIEDLEEEEKKEGAADES